MKNKTSEIFVSKLRNPYDKSTHIHIAKNGRFTKAEKSVLEKKYKNSSIQFEDCLGRGSYNNCIDNLSKKFFGQTPKNSYEYVRTTYKDNPWHSSVKNNKK